MTIPDNIPPAQPAFYQWMALMRDGTIRHQIDEHNVEHSVDVVQDADVAAIHLIPQVPSHPYIVLDVQPGETWQKYWIRTFEQDLDTGVVSEHPRIEAVGLQSAAMVRLFVYRDGSIRVTSATDP